MEFLAYFFRTVEETAAPKIPGLFIGLFILALFLISRYVKMPKLFAYGAIFLQVVILSWYLYSGNLLMEGLPLYHCRISIWVIGLGIIFEKKSKFITWISLVAMPCSILVLMMRDMDMFAFPHITNYYYFLGHGFIFLIAASYLDLYFEKNNFKDICIYSLSLHLGIYFVNVFLHTNYAYIMKLPLVTSPILNDFSFLVITLSMVAIVTTMQIILEATPLTSWLNMSNPELGEDGLERRTKNFK